MSSRVRYSEALTRIPVMPSDEQQIVAARYAATRDPRDAERLVLGNLRLVVKIAVEMGGHQRSDFMDLVQEGNAGLLYALTKFDPTRGTKLASYGGLWIRAFIMRYLMDTSRIVRFSSTRAGRQQFFGRSLPPNDVSLDAPVGWAEESGSSRSGTMLDTLSEDDAYRPDARLEVRERQMRFREALGALRPELDDREQAILDKRLLSESPAPLRELAQRFDITGERTRQIEQQLVARLRKRVADPGERLLAA
jgi:RNA polymerase sigma-32 factor